MMLPNLNSPSAANALEEVGDDSSMNREEYCDEDPECANSVSGHSTGTSLDKTNSRDAEKGDNAAKELRDTVIKHEEKAVKKSRIMVGTAIVLCAIAISVAVFIIAKKSDQNSFELEYEGIVKDIRSLVRWEVRYNFALMEQLSASTTIAAGYLNSTFPFHTEPQYEISGGFVDGMGGIMSAAFAPFVVEEQREQWENYTRKNQGWIEESVYLKKVHPVHRDALHGTIQDHEHDRRRRLHAGHHDNEERKRKEEESESVAPTIYRWENGVKVPEIQQPGHLYAPLWQVSPADYGAVNVNLLSDPRIASLYTAMLKRNSGVLSSNFEVGDLFDFLFDPEEKQFKKDPHGFILQPVYEKIMEVENQTMVGFLVAITPFGNLLDRLVPEGKDGIMGVLKDDCGNVMSFEMSSIKTVFVGYEDLHEPEFNSYVRVEENIEMYEKRIEGVCTHDLYIYPSSILRESYNTSKPIVYTTLVALAFFIVVCLFILYDWTITRRQNKTIKSALKTQALVTNLFPEEMGKRLISEAQQSGERKFGNSITKGDETFKKIQNEGGQSAYDRATLAKLYPEATVMFADLVGFTAWSSIRSPEQVFRLLETLYSSFDSMANRRRVFKVETIGDCYVAVCGLPQPRKNHQVVMARFANDCLNAIGPLLQKLEVELGPDTTDLGIRVGLNSGPVTAGVLRAERARFQLFGDTVNTASRMESTSSRNRIHISQGTADLLIAGGRGHWVLPREDVVNAKGKGELKTYWLEVKNDTAGTRSLASSVSETGSGLMSLPHERKVAPDVPFTVQEHQPESTSSAKLDDKTKRLVAWNTDVLLRLLRGVKSHRQAVGVKPDGPQKMKAAEEKLLRSEGVVFDELVDIVSLPSCETKASTEDVELSEMDSAVVDQLREYVTSIAVTYHPNSFHSFEHASHVTMSVNKLLNRIVRVDDKETEKADKNTYGLATDPLSQFAIVLSGLIHDVDHSGVPNIQLVKEDHPLAAKYNAKSVAECNSIDIAWDQLMQDKYKDLRQAIYSTKEELKRFRQICVVTVLATDIADRDLKEKRNARWEKAFNSTTSSSSSSDSSSEKEDNDRKATIVIEHIIQASDISHTMQHWHIYRKWNERLFMEMYEAYKSGRSTTDPSTFWYKGEIGFFDFYIIPLAKKLKECGVFGVSSDEYLNYALKNRQEWESKGMQIVESYLAKFDCEDLAVLK